MVGNTVFFDWYQLSNEYPFSQSNFSQYSFQVLAERLLGGAMDS